METRPVLSLFALCAVVAGCARNASLYPANDEAASGGVLTARFHTYGTGHGEIQIPMPDGEVLKGEYSIVRGGTIGFGTIYGSVYGTGGAASYHGQSSTYVMPGGSPGMASLFGDRGTSAQCEFYNDNFSGHGNGACKISKGALYRLIY